MSKKATMNAGEKANATRKAVVTSEWVKEAAASIRDVAAALDAYSEAMNAAGIKKMQTDGATQYERGLSTLKSFKKHIAVAIAKAQAGD